MVDRQQTGVFSGKVRSATAGPRYRYFLYDAIIYVALALFIVFVVKNVSSNLARLNITGGFAFLQGKQAGFGISESLIAYDAQASYGRAVVVGLLNTLFVSCLTIVFSTVLGTVIGILRLGQNRPLSKLAQAYVELFRNTPLLLQLMFWYALILISFPGLREATPVLGIALFTNRGLFLPWMASSTGFGWFYVGTAAGILAAFAWRWICRQRQQRTGSQMPVFLPSVAAVALLLILSKVYSGTELSLEWPKQAGFRIVGGLSLSPELATLIIGLTLYTSALIGEIVRSGISSVQKGQIEAARALGLHEFTILRLVILPLAIRAIVPPLTSQYLSLMKNSSLAVAIGYPDLASIINTIINQTGQAIEGIGILMGTYLIISLGISLALNLFNKRMALVQR
ncbi:ABC transporter permease subunit [Rhizobium tropici]|uniref:ABC transporter permease subunit n=1 Tax=Rhizobium tropici TaxID=398 RepID=A0A5B0WBT3_RHITR|nr:ABC transporter permease subunit [Rhizobium tropici]KAA1183948.1 ABC transporter permease subunit [Rhizobium tropici]